MKFAIIIKSALLYYLSLSKSISDTLLVMKSAQFDLIILETSGIGQSDTEILVHSDASLYVMTPEYGVHANPTQLRDSDTTGPGANIWFICWEIAIWINTL